MGAMYGLNANEFWIMTPKQFNRNIPFYDKQLEISHREAQTNAWIAGVYVAKAISANFKGKYPDKPIDFYGIDTSFAEDEETGEDQPKKRPADVEAFEAWAIAFNKQKFGKVTADETEVSKDG